MASIWKQNRDVTNQVNRNNFDLTKQCHDTFKFGYLYPVYCKPVYPTDTFRLRTAFDLKMMPMVFPLQSRVRAHLHFFYVRNKNLWKGWQDFISGLKSNDAHPHPYVRVPDNKIKTGSIHDYLGVPTTIVTKSTLRVRQTIELWNQQIQADLPLPARVAENVPKFQDFKNFGAGQMLGEGNGQNCVGIIGNHLYKKKPSFDSVFKVGLGSDFPYPELFSVKLMVKHENALGGIESCVCLGSSDIAFNKVEGSLNEYKVSETDEISFKNSLNNLVSTDEFYFLFYRSELAWPTDYVYPAGTYNSNDFGIWYDAPNVAGHYEYSNLGMNYFRDHQFLNALPYRAYQSIYYGYYANDVLQPLVINGEKEYNKFIENDNDGLDNTDYHFYKRNYELDFLTSALPSPQAGPAPLVGITALGDVTITDENGVSTGHAEIDSDGTITKIVATSPAASIDHARTMMNIASFGFNINDLRSANALQRLAEQTLRSGYRYVNWVKGQYGRSPEYRELDMAEFIGGFSRDVQIGTVVSTADTAAGGTGKFLGDFGANGRVVGGSNHDITHYCDDYGFIIGIMSVVPTPAYSQLLPKHMIAPTSPLDYANPFMNQIGMQPITYREVCPLQAYYESLSDSSKSVDDTFGYQRPNYDAVGEVDEVHGEFRASLKNYLINRQFDGRPELGSDFIQCSPEEINDIFVNQNPHDDVFIGNLLFQVPAKRPFPRTHIAGLGR